MWAILFDLSQKSLIKHYPLTSISSAYSDIKKALESRGFYGIQGSVYFGEKHIDVTDCFLAIYNIVEKFDWFYPSVKDIRILKIEDNNDINKFVEEVHKKYRNK